jgi:hypothetical protein
MKAMVLEDIAPTESFPLKWKDVRDPRPGPVEAPYRRETPRAGAG